MKVVIAGGAGFLGRALLANLASTGEDVVVLSRRAEPIAHARVVAWDGENPGPWTAELDGADAVVDYAGSPILCLWTRAARRRILDSRVRATRAIARAIESASRPPAVWVNGSATGYYGDTGDLEVDETSPRGEGFLPAVCAAWEAAATVPAPGVRMVRLRTGIVLDPHHPPLSLWLRATRLFMGGRLGNGKAFVPWISLRDHARLARLCLDQPLVGPVNAVAQTPVTNAELMALLRRHLHRPPAPPVPAGLIRAAGVLGVPAEAILASTRVVPAVAGRQGFAWQDAMLTDVLPSPA